MKQLAIAATLAGGLATGAQGGGVDRSGQPLGAIFTPGNYIEFSFATVNPEVTGTQNGSGASSGNQAIGFGDVGMTAKFAVSEKLDFALIFDRPFGADIAYPTSTGYFAAGAEAELTTSAVSAVTRYKFGNGFSAHAGLRYQSYYSRATVPFVGNWTGTSSADFSFGYLAGVAYERPEMALRVALTYFSKIGHDLPTIEDSVLGAGRASILSVETPQAVNLDFQTGVAPGTLVFGGVRWVNWSDFSIAPDDYVTLAGGQPLVEFENDTFTYTLGVGRQLTENWSVALTAVHEPGHGGFQSNLRPVDGQSALGLGVTYMQEGFNIQAGLQHIWLGDATTTIDEVNPIAEFEDNTALAFGLKMGFSF